MAAAIAIEKSSIRRLCAATAYVRNGSEADTPPRFRNGSKADAPVGRLDWVEAGGWLNRDSRFLSRASSAQRTAGRGAETQLAREARARVAASRKKVRITLHGGPRLAVS